MWSSVVLVGLSKRIFQVSRIRYPQQLWNRRWCSHASKSIGDKQGSSCSIIRLLTTTNCILLWLLLYIDALKKKEEEEEEFNEPGGLLFGEEPPPPGEKRKWEEWEAPWYTVVALVTFFGVYGLYQRSPDTSYVGFF